MRAAQSIADLVGGTPLLRLGRLFPEREVYAKCEFLNPLSLKDRPVLQILMDAMEEGKLKPGDTLLEATSGNTGMAVAAFAARMGFRALLIMSEIQSLERRRILRAFGAELILTPAELGTAGARTRLKEILAEHPEYFYVGQHVNPSNPRAHYRTTGPEIWQDTEGDVDILVAGLGTGGTLSGAGRYLKEKKPGVKVIGVEPAESPYISKGVFHPHRMMGTAPGFTPETLDRGLLDEIILISEEEAFQACRDLARREGVLVGISSGAVAAACAKLITRRDARESLVVGVFADSGQRYLSVEGLFPTDPSMERGS